MPAKNARGCGTCGHHTAMDYCRNCDEYYWIHSSRCVLYEEKHFGHRLVLVPFVEERS